MDVENKIVVEINREAVEICCPIYIYQRSVRSLILTLEISCLWMNYLFNLEWGECQIVL